MDRASRSRRQVQPLGTTGRVLAVLALCGASLTPVASALIGPVLIGSALAQSQPPAPPAQPPAPAPTPMPPQPGAATEGLAKSAEDLARSAGEVAKSVGGALGNLWNDVTGKITPGSPTDYLPTQISEEDKRFFAILEAIGLELKGVTVSKGVIPSANYRFVAAREPTDTDIARAEDLLRLYRESADGMWSRAKQRIARSTLDTVSTAGTTLTAMDVTLSPWPDASYQIATRPGADAPAGGTAVAPRP